MGMLKIFYVVEGYNQYTEITVKEANFACLDSVINVLDSSGIQYTTRSVRKNSRTMHALNMDTDTLLKR